MRYCPNCGSEISSKSRFCEHCGVKLSEFEIKPKKSEVEKPGVSISVIKEDIPAEIKEKEKVPLEKEEIDLNKAAQEGTIKIERALEVEDKVRHEGYDEQFETTAHCPMCGAEFQLGREVAKVRPLSLKCKECSQEFMLRH